MSSNPNDPAALMLWPALVLRWLLGSFLIYLTWPKLVHPGPFAAQLGNFQLLSPVVVGWAAAILPMVGFVLGAALLTGVARRGAAAATAFIALAAVAAILLARVRGLDLGCGCYGGAAGALSADRALVVSGLTLTGSLLLLLEPDDDGSQRLLVATLGLALTMLGGTESALAATPDTEAEPLWQHIGEGFRETNLVVEGRLAYRRTFRADGVIFTEHYFEVLNTFKGDDLNTVSCVVPGGILGEEGMLLVGSPRPVLKETYLLLLREHDGVLRLWQLDRGIIAVTEIQRILGPAWRDRVRSLKPMNTTSATSEAFSRFIDSAARSRFHRLACAVVDGGGFDCAALARTAARHAVLHRRSAVPGLGLVRHSEACA